MRSTSSRLGAGLCGGYGFLFAFLVMAVFVALFGVNVPYWDEWVLLPFWAKVQAGALSWQDLWAPQNEHRILMQRLAFVATHWLFGEWNILTVLVVSALGMGVTIGILAYTLARLGVSPIIIAVLAVLLTSPTQWDNILFGIQVQCYVLAFGVVASICAITLDETLRWRTIAVCVVGCAMVTGSIASGLALWPAIGGLLVVRAVMIAGGPRALLADRRLLARLAVFAGIAGALIVYFFIGYRRAPNTLGASSVWMFIVWMVRVLSCPLLDEVVSWPKVLLSGVLWLWVAVAAALYVARRRHAYYRGRLVLFIGFGLVLLANAMVTAYGRGATPYVPSRYTTLLLLNSVLWLVAAPDVLRWSQGRGQRLAQAARIAVSASVVALLLVHADRYRDGLTIMRQQGPDREAAKRALAFYLSDHSPNLPFNGFAVFPPHVFNQGDLGRPELIATLPPDMRPSLVALPVETRGRAWIPNGAYEGTQGTPPPLHWGTWRAAGAAATGRIRVGPLAVHETVLRVPIAGYLGASHSSLWIEDTANPHHRVAYAGPAPGDQWKDWNADVSSFVGRQVVLVGIDADQQHPGWFAFGRPMPMRRSLLVFDLALHQAGTALLGVLLTAVGLFAALAHLSPPRRRLRAFALASAVLLGVEALIATTWLARESSTSQQMTPSTRNIPRPRQ